MNIQGHWTGIVVYGKTYRKHKFKQLIFEMDITQDSEKISGKANDISGVGVNPDPASIEGTFIDGKIKFVKQYPSFHYYDRGETKNDKSRLGGLIYYSGELEENAETLSGKWFIRDKIKIFGIIPISLSNRGTWTMHRK